jgi:hypothetical protein
MEISDDLNKQTEIINDESFEMIKDYIRKIASRNAGTHYVVERRGG